MSGVISPAAVALVLFRAASLKRDGDRLARGRTAWGASRAAGPGLYELSLVKGAHQIRRLQFRPACEAGAVDSPERIGLPLRLLLANPDMIAGTQQAEIDPHPRFAQAASLMAGVGVGGWWRRSP